MGIQPPQHLPLPAGLRYYLLRGNVMVPLVPVDQLPFQLQGVPRQLTHRQISDGDWKLLKETEEPTSVLQVQAPATILPSTSTATARPPFLAPDHHVRREPADAASETTRHNRWSASSPTTQPSTGHLRSMRAIALEHPSSLIDSFASNCQNDAQRLGYRTPYPSGIEPDPSKKEFCTHWIKTGECAFISIGCKYKHEMPTTDRLRELGFTQVPKWWKEKSAIAARGSTWMQRRLASGDEGGDQLDEMPIHRAFPDPSTFRSKYMEEGGPLRDGLLQERSILKRDIIPEPPQAAISRRDSQIFNLLIDLGDTPAPPPSPQLSNSSSNSVASCDIQLPSSCSSESPPASPVPTSEVTDRKPDVVEHHNQLQTVRNSQIAKEPLGQPIAYRSTQISCASDSEENTRPIKPLTRRRATPLRVIRGLNASQKQSGLVNSKYAASNVKNAESRSRNRNRRVPQQKPTAIEANDLHIKIDQLRRNVHQEEKSVKVSARSDGRSRGVPAVGATVKQIAG